MKSRKNVIRNPIQKIKKIYNDKVVVKIYKNL